MRPARDMHELWATDMIVSAVTVALQQAFEAAQEPLRTFPTDPTPSRRALNAVFFTGFAGPLFALGHHHEIFSRLHIELLALLVTDHTVFFTAVSAHTLFRGAGNHLFDARQVCRQLLTARMLFGPFER